MLTKFQREVRDALLLLYGPEHPELIGRPETEAHGLTLEPRKLEHCETCGALYERKNSRMKWCPPCSDARRKASKSRRNARYWRNKKAAQ